MDQVSPTPERLAKGDIIHWEESDDAGKPHARVRTQTVLDRHYYKHETLTQRQYDAGMKLYALWRAAGGAQSVSSGYDVKVQFSQSHMTDKQVGATLAYQRALRAVGNTMAMILIAVCLADEEPRSVAVKRGEEARAGIAVLRLSLDALADAFGIPLDKV